MPKRTALCDLLGIEHPIVQSGMGGVAGPDLVAEVCRAGGLGILAGGSSPAGRAGGTFRPRAAVQAQLDVFRSHLGLPPGGAPLKPLPDLVDAAFEVVLDERVPVWSIGLGNPAPSMVEACHARGIK